MTQSRRGMATIYDKAIRADAHNNVKAKMLSDPATYPLIVILGFAVSFCSGFGVWFLTSASDVRIDPSKRNKLLRDWGAQ